MFKPGDRVIAYRHHQPILGTVLSKRIQSTYEVQLDDGRVFFFDDSQLELIPKEDWSI